MARFQQVLYSTGVVTAGGTVNTNTNGLPSCFNIVKVKIVGGTSFDVKIFNSDTYAAGNLLMWWDNVDNGLYDPMDDSSGHPVEAAEGSPLPYEDADATGELHLQIRNNDGVSSSYTVQVVYEEVPVLSSTGTGTFRGGVLSKSPTTGIGYITGAGGSVIQGTSKSTGVTLNKVSGQITLNTATLNAGTTVSFVMTNSTVAYGDVLVINHLDTGTFGAYAFNARTANGSVTIDVTNRSAGSLSEALLLTFIVIKAVSS